MKPEELNGGNQYECSQCKKKVDAIKGLKLQKCPSVLTIQLSRFTLDFNTFSRIKLNDRVSFPFLLNMNDYLRGYEGIENKLYEKEVARMQEYRQKEIAEKRLKEEERLANRKEQRERNMMMSEDKIGGPEDIEMQDLAKTKKKKERGIKIGVRKDKEEEVPLIPI